MGVRMLNKNKKEIIAESGYQEKPEQVFNSTLSPAERRRATASIGGEEGDANSSVQNTGKVKMARRVKLALGAIGLAAVVALSTLSIFGISKNQEANKLGSQVDNLGSENENLASENENLTNENENLTNENENLANENENLGNANTDLIDQAQQASEQTRQTAEMLYSQMPELQATLTSSMNLINQALGATQDYYLNAESEGASQEVLSAIEENINQIAEYQADAEIEQDTFDENVLQVEEDFEAGEYNSVITLMNELNKSVQTIGNLATQSSDSALQAAETYSQFQKELDENPIVDIEFTEADLNNYKGITKYLIHQDMLGSINGVDFCQYNRDNGEIVILVNGTSFKGVPYRNLITATIANGLQDLTAQGLIDRIKNVPQTRQVFDSELDGDFMQEITGGSTSASLNSVSGNFDVQCKVNAQYNKNTGSTTITASALAVVTDDEGKVLSYKVYSISPETRRGNIKTSEIQLEFEGKLADIIEVDSAVVPVEITDYEHEAN